MNFRISLIVALVLVGLHGQASGQSPVAPLDEKACIAESGHLQRIGKAQALFCVKPYADGGMPCRSKANCLGKCIDYSGRPDGQTATGYCQLTDAPLRGCFAEVERGKVTRSICID
jgi:hypothetical protein